jgi:phage terminase large subunit GpA-like protein
MRRAKGNLICADEIDAVESSESDEGDALEILWVRGSEYPDTIKIAASYPSVKGRSKIEALLLAIGLS